jgi:hypothetical protein
MEPAMTESSGPAAVEDDSAVDHFILTRFNVRSFYHDHEPTDAWLADRLELFRQYCLPSVAAQTDRRFRWLVFLDSKSPAWFRTEIEKSAADVFEPVYVDGAFDADSVSTIVAGFVSAPTVVTSRLDNDDAIAKDFVEVVRNACRGQDFEFVNLVNGAQLAERRVYLRPYTKNPFSSLVERPEGRAPRTVFMEHHYLIDKHGPIRNVRTDHPMWLQVIHGGNVLNEVVGLRVNGHKVSPQFGCVLDLDDSVIGLVRDTLAGVARIIWRLCRKPARLIELARTASAHPSGR